MSSIGKLEPMPLRELWKHEERGFSAWLESHLDALSEAIGVSSSDPQRELLAGNFQVDLVAEDENGERVIVENQLAGTDHDHLGKLLTYLTNLDAKAAIWISSAPRPEHIRAIQWLNETTPEDIREGGLTEEDKWPVIQDAMIAAMDRLAKAVKPHLASR